MAETGSAVELIASSSGLPCFALVCLLQSVQLCLFTRARMNNGH